MAASGTTDATVKAAIAPTRRALTGPFCVSKKTHVVRELKKPCHKGEIRERGSHRELLAQRGLYDRLYQLQLRGQEQRKIA